MDVRAESAGARGATTCPFWRGAPRTSTDSSEVFRLTAISTGPRSSRFSSNSGSAMSLPQIATDTKCPGKDRTNACRLGTIPVRLNRPVRSGRALTKAERSSEHRATSGYSTGVVNGSVSTNRNLPGKSVPESCRAATKVASASSLGRPFTLNSAYPTTCSITRPPVSVNLIFRPAL